MNDWQPKKDINWNDFPTPPEPELISVKRTPTVTIYTYWEPGLNCYSTLTVPNEEQDKENDQC